MAVSKRTRFEVLRRDNYTCRYCRSTEGELTVDHVVPIALGGSDDPSNLVAACRDCNAGKASTGPDESTVAEVDGAALRWAEAMARAAEITDAKAAESRELAAWFETAWTAANWGAPLPHNWAESVLHFRSLGLTEAAIHDAVLIAAGRSGVSADGRFRYFCGICWARVRELQQIARDLLAASEGEGA